MADPIDTDAVRAIICSLSCACHPALSAACDEVDHLRAELILAEKGRREDAAAHMANEAGVDRLRAENTEALPKAVCPSDDAHQAIADEGIGDPVAITAALAAVMPDGRTVAQWIDAVPGLVAVARWAQDAPHHGDCPARHLAGGGTDNFADYVLVAYPCTCGRDEAFARLKADR